MWFLKQDLQWWPMKVLHTAASVIEAWLPLWPPVPTTLRRTVWKLAGWGFLVLSAIVCHLPQLVLFHFRTVSAVNSRSDRNKNRLGEPPRWKHAHHTCKTNELQRCNTSVASLAAEMVLDVSDRRSVDRSHRTHQFVRTLPPLSHCLLSERCELQTSEP